MLFEEIIQSHYRPSEYPALASLAEEWQDSRPFVGLKILVATPIFRNTLLQYEALLAGGAELYVGRAVENAAIPCDFEIVELLQESEIPVVSPEMVLDMEQEDECPMQAEDMDFFNANSDALYMKSSVGNMNEDVMAEDMWYPPEEENWY